MCTEEEERGCCLNGGSQAQAASPIVSQIELRDVRVISNGSYPDPGRPDHNGHHPVANGVDETGAKLDDTKATAEIKADVTNGKVRG